MLAADEGITLCFDSANNIANKYERFNDKESKSCVTMCVCSPLQLMDLVTTKLQKLLNSIYVVHACTCSISVV